jgi:hypothetical protein
MILKNKYGEVMDRVEVTQEMRERILDRVQDRSVDKARAKAPFIVTYRKYFYIAACLVLLLAGPLLIHNVFTGPDNPPQQGIPSIDEWQSAQELSQAIGFTVKEISSVPFEVESVQYTSYFSRMAQIQYSGLGNDVSLRMEKGDEDISGDSTEYTDVTTLSVDGRDVLVKGDNGRYILALWQADGYTYAVRFTNAVSQQDMMSAVQSVQ